MGLPLADVANQEVLIWRGPCVQDKGGNVPLQRDECASRGRGAPTGSKGHQ